jgi:malonyl-CoA O-methyltransferase
MPERPPSPPNALLDKRQTRRAFSRAADNYDEVAVLQREIGDRMLERLDYVRLAPRVILDAGCGTGVVVDHLARRYRKAQIIALDFALPLLRHARRRGTWRRKPACVCGDIEHLPLPDRSVDLVFSNAVLQWSADLARVLAEFLRVLKPGGLFMFSTFGPDTLKELRAAWAEADGHSHVSPFVDMHDIGDLLVHTRFADPVMDAEWLTLTYAAVDDLMRDLKVLGAGNATTERPRGMTGRGRMAAMRSAYEGFRSHGRLPATYEVIYGQAWAPLQRRGGGGEVLVSPEQLRRR